MFLIPSLVLFLPIAHYVVDNSDYTSNPEWNRTLDLLMYRLYMNHDKIYDSYKEAIAQTDISNVTTIDFFIGFFAPISPATIITANGVVYNLDKEENKRAAPYALEFIGELYNIQAYNRADYRDYLELKNEAANVDAAFLDPDAITPGVITPFASGFGGSGEIRPPLNIINIYGTRIYGDNSTFGFSFRWSFIERYTSKISIEDAALKCQKLEDADDDALTHRFIVGEEKDFDGDITYVAYYLVNAESQFSINTPDRNKPIKTSGLHVPVSYEILTKLSYREQEWILQDSLYSVVVTVVEEEIKWFQQSFWKGVFIIVAIALVAFTLAGGLYGLSSLVGAAGATAAGGLGYTLGSFVTKILISNVVLVAASIGFESEMLGKILSAVTMMVGGFPGGIEGFMAQSTNTIGAMLSEPNAIDFLQVGSKVLSTGYNFYSGQQKETLEYNQEPADEAEAEENSSLGMDYSSIDATVSIARDLFMAPTETYEQFAERTLSTNPGQVAIERVANFVDIALTLPRTPAELPYYRKYTNSE
jgi:hypothetical protein